MARKHLYSCRVGVRSHLAEILNMRVWAKHGVEETFTRLFNMVFLIRLVSGNIVMVTMVTIDIFVIGGIGQKFFEEMVTFIDIALKKYENCIIIGDFTIDMDNPDSLPYAHLNNFCDIFDFANMINEKGCFIKKTHQGLT